jgi:hypothetical protein
MPRNATQCSLAAQKRRKPITLCEIPPQICCKLKNRNDLTYKKKLHIIVSMETKQDIVFLNEQKIKEILTAIKDTNKGLCTNKQIVYLYADAYFEVSIKNEKHEKYQGLYDYKHNRIILYLLNHKTNNELIGSAIHEFAHHLMGDMWGHQSEFWECYFELLEIAENKGFYSCNINKSDKLNKITTIIKQYDLLKNKKIFKKELDCIFVIIKKLCNEIDIDFQYYTVKYLGMDWYKKKNPLMAYNHFHKWYTLYSFHELYSFDRIERSNFLQNFFNDYCISK